MISMESSSPLSSTTIAASSSSSSGFADDAGQQLLMAATAAALSSSSGGQQTTDPAFALFRDQTRFWIQRVAVPLLMVIGVFGNLITVIIMTRRRMRSTTNMYLAALALVDMFYLVLTFLLGLSHYPNMAQRRYLPYWHLRPFLMMLTDACSNTSVWLTVTFTIERYIAVRYPMKGKIWCTEARARMLITCVFVTGILFASPVPFEWKVIEKRITPLDQNRDQVIAGGVNDEVEVVVGDNSSYASHQHVLLALENSDFGRNETYKTIYYWSTAVIFYFIPLISLTLFNGYLIKSVHQSKRERNKMTAGQGTTCLKQHQKQQQQQQRPFISSSCKNSTTSALKNGKERMAVNGCGNGSSGGGGGGGEHNHQLPIQLTTTTTSVSLSSTMSATATTTIVTVKADACSSSADQSPSPKLKGTSSGELLQLDHQQTPSSTLAAAAALSGSSMSHVVAVEGDPSSDSGVGSPQAGHVGLQSKVGSSDSALVTSSNNNGDNGGASKTTAPQSSATNKTTTQSGNSLKEEQASNKQQHHLNTNHTITTTTTGHNRLSPTASGNQLNSISSTSIQTIGHQQQQQQQQQHPAVAMPAASSQERRITIMLIAVVILFLFCQIPSAAMLLYTSVRELEPNTNEHALVLAFGNIFNFLMAVNAAGNFILYSFLSKKYRKTFVILFCYCLKPKAAISGAAAANNKKHYDQQSNSRTSKFSSIRHSTQNSSSSFYPNRKPSEKSSQRDTPV